MIVANFAREIDTGALAEVPDSAAYAAILVQLVASRETDPRPACVSTTEQQVGTIWFIVDFTNGYLAYLHEYADAPGRLKVPVTALIGVDPYGFLRHVRLRFRQGGYRL